MLSVSIIISVIFYYCESAGRSYTFVPGRITYPQAQTACANIGMQLATIIDQDDVDALYADVGISTLEASWSWIGLDDLKSEGDFEWLDGTPCTYPNPDSNGNINCVGSYQSGDIIKWVDGHPVIGPGHLDCGLVRIWANELIIVETFYLYEGAAQGAICSNIKEPTTPITPSPTTVLGIPTSDPTMSPTEKCAAGTGYLIDGISAYATGDPHFV